MRRTLLAFALLALAGAALWWLQHPPRTAAEYRRRAVESAQSLRSQAGTARLWVREVGDGRLTHAAASVAIAEASAGAAATASTFESWVPPRGLDELRAEVAAAATATNERLRALHVAAERDAWDAVAAQERPLRKLEARLRAIAAGASG